MSKINRQDIEDSFNTLKEDLDGLALMAGSLKQISGHVLASSILLDKAVDQLDMVNRERFLLYKLVMYLLSDSGIYNYSMNIADTSDLDGFDLEISFNEDGDIVNFSIKYPDNTSE